MIYKDRLKELREDKMIKQRKIAVALKISESSYGTCENEIDIFPLKHLINICNYFDVSFDYLFGFSSSKKYLGMKGDVDKSMVGKRLRGFRKEQKKSQTDLAKELNSSYGTLSGYEKGRYLISTAILYDLCKKYKISADYILGRIDEPKYLK